MSAHLRALCVLSAYKWTRRLVEGEWTDPAIPDPLSQMFLLLTARRNRALIQQWGVWLAGKDVERALKVGQCQAIYSPLGTHLMNVCGNVPQLLTAHGSTKRGHKAEDEAATLQQIRAVNPEAGVRFLEHLVLQKRRTVSHQDLSVHSPVSYLISQDPALHTELALTYIDEVLAFVADDAIPKLWRAKGTRLSPRMYRADANYATLQAASYASSSNPSPFLSYFESTTPTSPAKHARLRTALFLQTSSAYDASAARSRLAPHAPLLAPELAITAGKVCCVYHEFIITIYNANARPGH